MKFIKMGVTTVFVAHLTACGWAFVAHYDEEAFHYASWMARVRAAVKQRRDSAGARVVPVPAPVPDDLRLLPLQHRPFRP